MSVILKVADISLISKSCDADEDVPWGDGGDWKDDDEGRDDVNVEMEVGADSWSDWMELLKNLNDVKLDLGVLSEKEKGLFGWLVNFPPK